MFDVAVVHEDDVSIAFKFENIVVNLLENRAAPGLIEPASVAGPEPGSRFQLTVGSRTPTRSARSWQSSASSC